MFKLDLSTCVGIHLVFNAYPLKLFESLMLDVDEEEFIVLAPKGIVAEVGVKVEEDKALSCREWAIILGNLSLYQIGLKI